MKIGGAGEIILTRLVRARAAIQVPGDADRYLIYRSRTSEVMGELIRGGKTRLSLPAGRFVVARLQAARMSVAEVDLSWGGTRRLSARDFRPITHEEFVVRGGVIEFRPFR